MLSAVAVFCFLTLAQAEDKKAAAKEVTLKGTITCCKCDLKIADKCATAIKVKEKDKDVIYVFDADSNKKYHAKICKSPMEGTVKGTVKEDGKKKIITVTELKFE
jgi:hypothetical protein